MTREERFNAAVLAYIERFGKLFDTRMISPPLYKRLPEALEDAVLRGEPIEVPELSREQLTVEGLVI